MSDTMEDRIKELIVESLGLEDVTPAEIETEEPLFGEGLGLDSIDALELAMAIHSEFGVRTEQNDERNREYYYSVKSLGEFVRRTQQEQKEGASATEGAPTAAESSTAVTREVSTAKGSSTAES